MSSKDLLIEQYRGEIKNIRELAKTFAENNIYDENGYVDNVFLLSVLSLMADMTSAELELGKALNKMLGIKEEDDAKPKKGKVSGATWSVEKILQNCRLEDGVMKLPNVQLSKKNYLEAKKWIEEAGGTWSTKEQGFAFDFNPDRVFKILHEGRRCNLKQEFQFFATPAKIADYVASKFSGITKDMTVLEPSAGTGSLIDAVHRICPDVVIDCYELMPENMEQLRKKDKVNIKGEDFFKCEDKYQRIIANPPFAKNQDIDHVMRMYEILEDGGEMSVITSPHWELASEKKCVDFRKFLEDVKADVEDIDGGEFKESGTTIRTKIVYLKKQHTIKNQQLSLF